jgi:hypothetical protein
MSGMTLGDVLSILAEKCDRLTLHEAMYTARGILELSNSITDSVAQESYNKGHVDGYEAGKNDAEVPSTFEMVRLRRIEEKVKEQSTGMMPGIVFENGSHNKVKCIKALRNRTGLGLKDSKDIADAYIDSLNDLTDWERKLVDPLYVPRPY